MKIIDARVFVPYGTMRTESKFFDVPFRYEMAQRKYNLPMALSAIEASMDRLLQEMDEAGIVKAFTPALFGMDGKMENSEMAEFLSKYGDRFEGFAVAYPHHEDAVEEIERYVVNGPCRGVVVEPGWGECPMPINDRRVYPIYEYCEAHDIPMMLGFGGRLNPSLKMFKGEYLDEVLHDFPKLRACAVHGGWPYADDMCWLALMHENFYVMPDVYMCGTPFSDQYMKAANTVVKDKIIFASAYPIVSQKDCIQAYKDAGLREDCYENVFYKNALRFLGENI